MASRPVQDVAAVLGSFPYIDLKAEEDDLKVFVNSKISTLPEHFGPELREVAEKILLQRAERTFLWVSIVVKRLERMTFPSVAKLKATVEESWIDLDKLYSDIIGQIIKGSNDEQKLVAWVAYGQRPLTLSELEDGLATQTNSRSKRSTDDHRTNLTASAIASAAGMLLEMKNNTVHLIHQSAKEFILQGKQLASASFANGLDPEIYLAEICMTYLNFDDFKNGPCSSLQKLAERKIEYPLLDYAARKWHTHIQGKSDVGQVSNVFQQLIQPRSPTLLSWGEAAGIKNLDTANDTLDIAMKTGIMWLAECNSGHTKITEGQVRTAAENLVRGYEMMETILRQRNKSITEEAIQAVVRHFNEKIVKLLLDNHVGIKVTEAMILAAAANRKNGRDVVELLLVTSGSIEITTELVEVAEKNEVSGKEVICLLLSRNNVTITERAEVMIAGKFDTETIELLLDGRRVTKITTAIVGALASNIFAGREVMELLLSRGDVQITEDTVVAVVRRFGVAMVTPLLGRGLDIQMTEAVLDAAAGNNYYGGQVVEFLLSKNDIQVTELVLKKASKEKFGELLEIAAMEGHRAVVQLLLEKGADVEAKASKGETALHLAASKGHEAVVLLLLEKGTNVDAMAFEGETALHLAVSRGDEALVLLLLDKGAGIEAKNHNRCTALHLAAFEGHRAVVLLLLEKGADVEAMAFEGETALHLAASKGHEAVLLLLGKGAGIEAKNHNGCTALHFVASRGHEAVAALLLKKGADVNAKDGSGKTALDIAISNRHNAVVQLLL